MKNTPNPRPWTQRALSGFMAFAMGLGFVPPSYAQENTPESVSNDLILGEDIITVEETHQEVQYQDTLSQLAGEIISSDEIVLPEETGHWSDDYINRMVEYGYLRANEAADPDAELTRAEFAAVVNRAYNYTELRTDEMPYTDVGIHDWFFEDISIATNAGYISGTSESTIEPYSNLDRQTTAFILGRNMMLPELHGEDLNFTDTRDISSWARSMVKATSDYGLMAGYSDGTFRPQNNITYGEISALVLNAVGTPILQGGETSLYEVLGNVTITEPGTILKNTVIAGDLYISNGIGLGDVTLENVTVLGRIVVSGGESQNGQASVLLRNVVANELVIDNMDDQYVSVRVDGNTYIEETFVRTNSFIEDTTTTDEGLRNITIEADPGTLIDFSGRIKTVNNISAGTTVRVTAGTVDEMNIDEQATEVVTEVLRGGEIIQLNIDVATNVTGEGDVQNLVVNASDVVVEMLPDNIIIRPGLNANINGQDMDNLTAEEFSTDPMILSGYPRADDVAPTTMDAVFATNKQGTLYWGISYITQGSISAADLIKPPSYGSLALQNGSMSITAAEEEFTAPVAELYIGGDYYLSAVLVDANGKESPVKVISFSTPDDTIPAFVESYPYISSVSGTSAQATVMVTKDCVLYYAVLSTGAMAPTPADFISGAVSGTWGNVGKQSVEKNKTYGYTISSVLQEMTDYDAYFWLTDADHMLYSEVVKLSFSTIDVTPPVFNQEMTTTSIGVTDVSFNFNMNEDGTVFWAVVPSGTYYPVPQPPNLDGLLSEPLTTEYAAYAVMWGVSSAYNGELSASANETMDFSITGLDEETAYDMYYVGRDEAGNFSSPVKVLTFNTIDNTPPTYVDQLFSQTANADNESTPQPYATTDITLVFSEGIQYTQSGQSFLQLYSNVLSADNEGMAAAQNTLAAALAECFTMNIWNSGTPTAATVRDADNAAFIGDSWVIDYRFTEVTLVNGEMHIKFPTNINNSDNSALNLGSGVTYNFDIKNIRDSSSDANTMQPAEESTAQFTTVYAQIMLGSADIMVGNLPYARTSDGKATEDFATVDADLRVTPSDMSNVNDNIVFELRMEPDSFVTYDMYMRVVDRSGNGISQYTEGTSDYNAMMAQYPKAPDTSYMTTNNTQSKVAEQFVADNNGWIKLSMNDAEKLLSDVKNPQIQGDGNGMGVGLIQSFWGYQDDKTAYPTLNTLGEEYSLEFCFEVLYYDNSLERGSWNGTLNIGIDIFAGNYSTIKSIGGHSSPALSVLDSLSLISRPTDYTTTIVFSDSIPPYFNTGAPQVVVSDITAELKVALDRTGEVYYVVVPATAPANLGPKYDVSSDILVPTVEIPDINSIYFESGKTWPVDLDGWDTIVYPTTDLILGQVAKPGDGVISGKVDVDINSISVPLDELDPLTNYYIYFVTKSATGGDYSIAYLAQFTTLETEKPKYQNISADPATGNVTWTTHVASDLQYLMLTTSTVEQSISWVNGSFYEFLLDLSDEKSSVLKPNTTDDYYTFVELYEGSTYYLNHDSKTTDSSERYTILDMLTTKYVTTGQTIVHPDYSQDYTVFDVYASDTLKKKMYDAIIAQTNNIVAKDTASPAAGETTTAERNPDSGYDPDFEYILFITGSNQNADTAGKPVAETHSFSALANFAVTDLNGPKLLSVSTGGASYNSTTDGYTGSVTVSFDKYVYAAEGSRTYFIQQLAEAPSIEPWDIAANRVQMDEITSYSPINSNGNATGTKDIELYTDGLKADDIAKGFRFNFTDIQNGSTITMFNEVVFLSNKDGVQHDQTTSSWKTLVLTFHVEEYEVSSNTTTSTDAAGVTTTTTTTVTACKVWWTTNWDDIDSVTPNYIDNLNRLTDVSSVGLTTPDTSLPTTPSTPSTTTPSTPTTPTTPTSTVSNLQVQTTAGASTYTMLLGETLELKAVWDGEAISDTVTWSIKNGGDSTFYGTKAGENYAVTAKSPNTYTVSAKVDGEEATMEIVVADPTVSLTAESPTSIGKYGAVTATISNVMDPTGLRASFGITGGASLYKTASAHQSISSGSTTSTNWTDMGSNTYEVTYYYTSSVPISGELSFGFVNKTASSVSYTVESIGSTGVTGS